MWGWPLAVWDNVAFWTLVGGSILAGLGVALTGFSSIISLKTASITQSIADSKIADASLESARAAEKAAVATEATAKLNLQAEQLRNDNLALQRLMLPRRLGSVVAITSPDEPDTPPAAETQFAGIRAFSNVRVLLQVVPDFEAQTLANDMLFVLGAFGWHVEQIDESISRLSPRLIADGVQVTYTREAKFADAAQALAGAFTNAGLTGPSGWGLSRVFAQGMPVYPDGTPAETPGYPKLESSIAGIIVLVGMKPIPKIEGR